jgi:hypothetical protein
MASNTYLRREQIPASMLRPFAGYTGQKFKVVACESVTISDTTWSGGTRSTWTIVRMFDGATSPLDTSKCTPKPGDPFAWIPDADGRSFAIPEGFAVVEHSVFRGKDMGLTFHVRPEALAPLLPPPLDITDRDRLILGCFTGLKSGEYRQEALRKHGYTDVDRDRLASLGLLKVAKNGATGVTIEGRNASLRGGY